MLNIAYKSKCFFLRKQETNLNSFSKAHITFGSKLIYQPQSDNCAPNSKLKKLYKEGLLPSSLWDQWVLPLEQSPMSMQIPVQVELGDMHCFFLCLPVKRQVCLSSQWARPFTRFEEQVGSSKIQGVLQVHTQITKSLKSVLTFW